MNARSAGRPAIYKRADLTKLLPISTACSTSHRTVWPATVMALGGTLDYFVASVLNYPTLSEGYKVAALDAEARLCAAESTGCVL